MCCFCGRFLVHGLKAVPHGKMDPGSPRGQAKPEDDILGRGVGLEGMTGLCVMRADTQVCPYEEIGGSEG